MPSSSALPSSSGFISIDTFEQGGNGAEPYRRIDSPRTVSTIYFQVI
jgi:hypothetical protein